ncbi:MAG: EamA family transporter [Candidatus Diapherotrites archaeon]|nr:EamA family transporter [Candidatus Diapherotrites archaeon]
MDTPVLLLALASAMMAALVAIFGKIGLSHVDANTATAIRAIIMALFLLLVITLEGKLLTIPSVFSDSKAITFIVLSGVAGALSWMFYFLAIKLGDVSSVVPIDRLSVVFVLVLAALFLGEKITLKTAIGTCLVAAGAIVIALG